MNMYISRNFDSDLNVFPLLQLDVHVEVRYNRSDWKLAYQLLCEYERKQEVEGDAQTKEKVRNRDKEEK